MALSRKPGPVGFSFRTTPGANAQESTGIHPGKIYAGEGLFNTPGPVGVNDAAARTALFIDDDKHSKSAPRRRTGLKMKVEIIEHPNLSFFTDRDRTEIKTGVSSELKRIKTQLTKSKAEFTVSWTQPKTLPLSAATPKVLLVYVVENSQDSIQQAIRIAEAALPDGTIDGQELATHVSKEAGYNAKVVGGKTSVSFMSITQLQKYKQTRGGDTNKMFANIILHEIGHGMRADHLDKGVMEAKTVYGSAGVAVIQYSRGSIDKIDTFLSTI